MGQTLAIIPKPEKITIHEGIFVLNPSSSISSVPEGKRAVELLQHVTGLPVCAENGTNPVEDEQGDYRERRVLSADQLARNFHFRLHPRRASAFIGGCLGDRVYGDTKDEQQSWAVALLRQGWAAYTWPVEYGGPGWTPTQRYIWERETGARGLPARLGGMGMMMLAPILQTYGTEEQKLAHLPGILENRLEWCQGYSEPGAGSDLAALATRAVRDGDD